MALFKILRGESVNLADTPVTDGFAYFTPEDGKFYIDYGTSGDEPIFGRSSTDYPINLGPNSEQLVPNRICINDNKNICRFVVGASTAGWTSADCDYLCDGTADDVEINAAITALPATGGEIVILDGTYNITAKIDVTKDNVSIRGNGNATILKRMFSSSVAEGVITLTSRSGCKIANLQIDGNKASYTSYNNYGIYLSSSSNNTVTGNTCNNNRFYGVYLHSSSNNIVTGNTCNNNNNYGIYLHSSSNNTVTGNTCNNNYGIYLHSSSNNTVTGNTCNNNNYGIYLDASSNNTVTGNTCIRGTGLAKDYTSSQHTIRLYGTGNSYNLISNNNCMGKAVTNGGGTGNSVYGNKYDSGDYKDFTQDEKTKLAGIATGANKYTHPATHPASMITDLPTSLPADGGNADTVGGFSVGAATNNSVNSIVRTDNSGYLNCSWLRSTSGVLTGKPHGVWVENGNWLYYQTTDDFINNCGIASLGSDGKVPPSQLPQLGFLPQIVVTAPTGSNVTCTKGTTTLTATEASGTWTFDVPDYGTWTVTGTLGAGTDSKAVVVDQVKRYAASLVYLSDTFSANTWAKIIGACQNGNVPTAWVVGNQKTMTINSASYTVTIIGKNHDTYTAGGTAPLTFQLRDCYGTKRQMNSGHTNSGGWTSCAMRGTHLPAILALMPTEVKAAIQEVNKLSSAGSESATINTTADKLFLLSEIEIFGTVTYSKAGEGSQYDWYKAGNTTIKKVNGSANDWWERSPSGYNATGFCFVGSGGGAGNGNYASSSRGVAFGFCF